MDKNKVSEELLQYIQDSPSCFHAVKNVEKQLVLAGYQKLYETENWSLQAGGKYYVTRNSSSLIAFSIPRHFYKGFQIVATHSDAPCFKLKENAEILVNDHYVKLNVEKYGGMLMAPWFDRPLSIAGRVIIEEKNGFAEKLFQIDRDLCNIPNLAIHMNREANKGYEYHVQTDLQPIFGDENSNGTLQNLICEKLNISKELIITSDLFLYNREPGTFFGARNEFIMSPKLDDLQCTFASMKAFLQQDENEKAVPVMAIFDNEETGSGTKQGAMSTFLKDCLKRMNHCTGGDEEQYYRLIAGSFLVSADNAHALHPNHPDKSDPVNRPYMNQGVVIKYNANQKYTTDAISAAYFKKICKKAEVSYQVFANHSDQPGGSTLGNLSNIQVSLNAVDIGLAQLSMHSPYETAGAYDTAFLIKALKCYYEDHFEIIR